MDAALLEALLSGGGGTGPYTPPTQAAAPAAGGGSALAALLAAAQQQQAPATPAAGALDPRMLALLLAAKGGGGGGKGSRSAASLAALAKPAVPPISTREAFLLSLMKNQPRFDPNFDPGPMGQIANVIAPLAAASIEGPRISAQEKAEYDLALALNQIIKDEAVAAQTAAQGAADRERIAMTMGAAGAPMKLKGPGYEVAVNQPADVAKSLGALEAQYVQTLVGKGVPLPTALEEAYRIKATNDPATKFADALTKFTTGEGITAKIDPETGQISLIPYSKGAATQAYNRKFALQAARRTAERLNVIMTRSPEAAGWVGETLGTLQSAGQQLQDLGLFVLRDEVEDQKARLLMEGQNDIADKYFNKDIPVASLHTHLLAVEAARFANPSGRPAQEQINKFVKQFSGSAADVKATTQSFIEYMNSLEPQLDAIINLNVNPAAQAEALEAIRSGKNPVPSSASGRPKTAIDKDLAKEIYDKAIAKGMSAADAEKAVDVAEDILGGMLVK